MSWTSVPKPTGANYSYSRFAGKQTYDQSNLSYNDSSVYYDSTDMNAYTLVAKPSDGRTIRAGMATGLLMPLTYSSSHAVSGWTKVNKPS